MRAPDFKGFLTSSLMVILKVYNFEYLRNYAAKKRKSKNTIWEFLKERTFFPGKPT